MIRGYEERDLEQVKRIHEKFYKNQFPLPDFFNNFVCAFSVIENDKLILSGGVRTILETIAITDKDNPVRLRAKSLFELLSAMEYISDRNGYKELHTTVIDDPVWEKQLKSVGFQNVKGNVLVLEISK